MFLWGALKPTDIVRAAEYLAGVAEKHRLLRTREELAKQRSRAEADDLEACAVTEAGDGRPRASRVPKIP